MKVYKTSDKIPVKIGDIVVTISPLSRGQKQEILSLSKNSSGILEENAFDMSALALKYSVKNIKGLKNLDGSDYNLKLDESGFVSDESIDDLFNIEENIKLIQVMGALTQGFNRISLISGVEIQGDSVEKK